MTLLLSNQLHPNLRDFCSTKDGKERAYGLDLHLSMLASAARSSFLSGLPGFAPSRSLQTLASFLTMRLFRFGLLSANFGVLEYRYYSAAPTPH